ncbi:hypothetical protein [Thalassovita mangrovi]|uniref:Uncharacterized protein n=1 Tax=Thalassovita mangrovi TaxID=2692236 RepID=A0A6L8LEU4_9RHOB|nr:hypothetical protein [Thalassovita mangrovi]MYM54591.1 hypothetical protein [Thalassovita mangrovi]
MPHSRKIATCCYCGRRAELVLTGEVRHELSCASCGAPLHNLKRLRSDAVAAPEKAAKLKPYKPKKSKAKKVKRRKGFGAKLLDELFDAVEDIFD